MGLTEQGPGEDVRLCVAFVQAIATLVGRTKAEVGLERAREREGRRWREGHRERDTERGTQREMERDREK